MAIPKTQRLALRLLVERDHRKLTLFRRLLIGLVGLTACLANAGEFTNFIGMRFRDIPTGSFYMGACQPFNGRSTGGSDVVRCPSGSTDDFDEHATINSGEFPQHLVTISRNFQMGLHEVTYGQFWKYLLATQPHRIGQAPRPNLNNLPVTKVSWPGAQKFITWLNENKPASDTGSYRLPTEAEWEYAARAGSTHRYSWGATMRKGMANCNDPTACGEKYTERAAPVGSFPPNKFGLYDMAGNVWEWVEDCWHDNFAGAPQDGSAWTAAECEQRVAKGGGFNDDPYFLRHAVRSSFPSGPSNGRLNTLGFRVVHIQ
jgi:formylglycine-generating enzyme required for sulfatase activity